MAKRDVDVVIGARTDTASFQQTEQKTKTFLQRLRGGGRGGGGSALERTARAQETLSKVVAAAAILNEGVGAFTASLEIAKGLSAGIAGDFERMDSAILKAKESLSQTLVGRAGLSVGEAIFNDESDAQKIRDNAERSARSQGKLMAAARENARLMAQAEKLMTGLGNEAHSSTMSPDEAAVFAIEQRMGARTVQLGKILEQLVGSAGVEEAFLNQLRDAIDASHDFTVDSVNRYRAALREAFNEQIRSAELANNIEERLFGTEGIEREIEIIKIRTEARERELRLMLEQAKTEEERARIQRLILDYQRRAAEEIKRAGATEPANAAQTPDRVRFQLPSTTQSLLMSGNAAAAQSGASLAHRQIRTAENTEKNTKETVAALKQLLQSTQGQAAPVLN